MPREKPTTYRATWEFALRFPSDYKHVRSMLESFTKGMEDSRQLQNSFLSIEKIVEDDGDSR